MAAGPPSPCGAERLLTFGETLWVVQGAQSGLRFEGLLLQSATAPAFLHPILRCTPTSDRRCADRRCTAAVTAAAAAAVAVPPRLSLL